jgi:hypothetical protein
MKTYLIPAFLLLSACGGGDNEGAVDAPAKNETEAAPAIAPPAAPPLAWTGNFAASKALCSGGVWQFEETQVKTQGATNCSINNVVEEPGLVDLTVSCTAEGMDAQERWTLSPNAGGGMTVVRETAGRQTAKVDLIRC